MMRASSLLRLSPLLVLALLLAALPLFHATPVQAQGPAAPTGLTVTAADGGLSLSWTAPAGTVTGYDVHYTSAPASGNDAVANNAAASGSDPAAAWVDAENTFLSVLFFIDSLDNDTTYRVRVRATNSGGSSAWVFGSGTPEIVLQWLLNPAATEVTEGENFDGEAHLSNTSGFTDAISAGLTYAAGSSNPASLADDLPSGYATTIASPANQLVVFVIPRPVDDAVNEEHETFTVTINAGTGYTLGTRTVLTLTIVDNDPPAAPPLSLTPGNQKLTAKWTKPAGPVTGYQLRYKTVVATDQTATTAGDPTTGWVTSTPSGTATSAEITGLTNGTPYYVQLRATDGQTQTGNGYGDWAQQSGVPAVPDATLLGLTATSSTSASGTFSVLMLSPSFAAATTAYTATVVNTVTHVKITPTVSDSNATVEVGLQGQTLTAVADSQPSGAIALSVGANAITVKVTAQDRSTTKTYTVTVTRAQPSADADLSGLTATQAESASGTFSALALSPAFAAATTAYTASVGNSITHLKLRPTASDAYATVEVGKGSSLATVTSGQESGPISLSFGANAITVKVTAENGSNTNTYTVTVTRAEEQPSGAPPAAATGTEGTLVSNLGQTYAARAIFNNNVHAQGFTTGPYVDGYTLTSIDAILGTDTGITSEDAATVRAELWSDSNGTPGTRVAYLTARNIPIGVPVSHTVAFVPSYGITVTLAANTTYHFVIYTTGGQVDLDVQLTGSAAEDAGAAAGWSIANTRSNINQNTPPWIPSWTTAIRSVQIAVKGKPVSISHWAATLAVKDLGRLAGDGCIGQQQCSDQLSPGNSFTHGAWPYNVLAVRVVRGSLQILLDRAPRLHPDQTRLDVGGRQFQFKDASESWGIDRNEDAWRLTWHGTGLDWSDGDTVSVSLVGKNVPAPPTPAPNTDLHPVRVHYDEMRDGEPVDNFNNLRLASPNPSGQPGRRVELRAYIPGTFHSADPEKGIVTTTHVMLRVRAHPASTLEWAIGNVYGVTGTFAAFPNGGFTPAIALNPASKWTYVYLKVTNGSQSATHLVAIDPPPRTYTLSPQVSVTEGEEATLSLSLGSPAGAGGVSFTVSADYPDGGATAEDVGQFAATLTVPEGQQSAGIIIPTVDDEAVEEDEERFTVRVAHAGEPAWAVDPEGTAAAVVTIVDNDEPAPPPPPPEGPEPWNIRVVPGDGTLTVTWNVGSRAGFEDSDIWHVLRWSQEPGVWANPRDPRAVSKSDGLSVDPGLTGYTITGLKNGVATGVFIRSMVGHRNNMSERDGKSSEWVRTKGEHTTPVAPPNAAPTVSAAIADATIVSESGMHNVSLSGVFSDANGDDLTITATSSDDAVATVSVSADYSTLTVSAKSRGTATVTVSASDGNGGTVDGSFAVTVKSAPSVASAIDDISELEAEESRTISLSGVFSDGDGDSLTVTASSSDEGKATVSVSDDRSALTVSGVAKGTATITVTAQDADGNTVSDAFDVTVSATPNNAPTVSSVIADATIVNESGTHRASLSGVFDDSDGDDLTVTAASSAESVATVAVSADYSKLTVSAKSRGTATVTVTASDGNGGAVEDAFTVTVKAAPVVASPIADISGLEAEDSRAISMSGVFSDADGDTVTVTEASSSDSAVAAVSAAIDGATSAITGLTVIAKSEGTATITITAQDADGNRVSDAFDVTVSAPAAQQQVNNAPTVSAAIADATIVSDSGTHRVALSGVFSDADGDDLTVTAASSAESVAIVAVSADYSTLTVSAKSRGTATITVTAADGYGGSVADSFTVTVKAGPTVSGALVDVSGLEAGATRDVSLSGVFGDADGDSLTISAASSNEATATVSVASDGSKLTVTGVADGTATVTVTAQDTDGNTVSDVFGVTVVRAPEPEPEPVELPGPVVNLQLTATDNGIIVSWQAPESGDAPRRYIVHVRPEGGPEGSGRTKTPKAKKTKVTFENLEAGRTYKVWVRAENEAGKGERVHTSITIPAAAEDGQTGQ